MCTVLTRNELEGSAKDIDGDDEEVEEKQHRDSFADVEHHADNLLGYCHL